MIQAKCVTSAVLLVLLFVPQLCHCFSLEKMCETRCLYGRGGILCDCNAFHFAGKRDAAESHSLLDRSSPFRDRKYRDSSLANGGMGASASGASSAFLSDGSRGDVGGHGDGNDDGADVVVEGFFGVEGHERSAVEKLASILKSAIDER